MKSKKYKNTDEKTRKCCDQHDLDSSEVLKKFFIKKHILQCYETLIPVI